MKTKCVRSNWKRLNIVLSIIAIFIFSSVTADALEETITFEGQPIGAIEGPFTEGSFIMSSADPDITLVIAERGAVGNKAIENSTPGVQTLLITATEGESFYLKQLDLGIIESETNPTSGAIYIRGYKDGIKLFYGEIWGDVGVFQTIDPGQSLTAIDELHIVLGGGGISYDLEAVDNIVLELLPCDPCFEWKNHGQYVRCVAQDADALVEMGYLTEEEADALVTSAAQSRIGKKDYIPPECQ